MSYTVLGVFDDRKDAEQARRDLGTIGISDHDISLRSGDSVAADDGRGFWESLKGFFTGENEEHAGYFAEAVRRGGTVIEVEAPENKVDQVVSILQRYRAVDINDRAQAWRKSGWTGYNPSAPALSASELAAERSRYASQSTAGTMTNTAATAQASAGQQQVAVPVVEEELKLGKRQVQRGGVRIVRRVTERPVSETINLREEHVDVQRRAVDRPLTAADRDAAFKDKTIEVTETSEEAVAAKQARVVEEVVVNKDVKQRQEQVKDTVRRTDVEVQRIPGKDTAERSSTTESSSTSSQQKTTRVNP